MAWKSPDKADWADLGVWVGGTAPTSPKTVGEWQRQRTGYFAWLDVSAVSAALSISPAAASMLLEMGIPTVDVGGATHIAPAAAAMLLAAGVPSVVVDRVIAPTAAAMAMAAGTPTVVTSGDTVIGPEAAAMLLACGTPSVVPGLAIWPSVADMTMTAPVPSVSVGEPPAAGISDDFNRANGGLGTNWTTITGYSAPTIASNGVGSPSLGTRAGAYWSAGSITNNHYAEIDHNAVFPCVRVQSGAATYYKLEWWYDDVDLFTGAYEVKRVVAGVASAALASTGWNGSTAGGKVRLEVTDVGGNPRLVAKKGASTLFTYDDTSGSKITTTGRPGIDTTMTGAAGDNFAAGDL